MELNELIEKLHVLKQTQQELTATLRQCSSEQIEVENKIKKILEKNNIEYENLSEEMFQLLLVDMQKPELIKAEVVYADQDQQIIKSIQVPVGASIEDCISISEIQSDIPAVDINKTKVGIYGCIKPLTHTINDGDRVEIYRPVEAKPAK